MMGSPADEERQENEEHQHKVTITKSFYMQTTGMILPVERFDMAAA
jgi:hypothetical protein